MNNKWIFFVLICFLLVFSLGCQSTNKIPYWVESENRFYTKDLQRAQKEIPFTIIIPTYLPQTNAKKYLPDIEGPLSQFQGEKIEVIIGYGLKLKKTVGALVIYEKNYGYSQEESALDPEDELIEMANISVVKTKDDWGSGFDAYYNFNSKGIYYSLEAHGIPNNETFKIVESIINQIK